MKKDRSTTLEPAVVELPKSRLDLVKQMIRNGYVALGSKEPSVADMIRLMTFEQELEAEKQDFNEVRVTWVRPSETEFSR